MKTAKIKFLFTILIGLIPINTLKILLLRYILGYRIDSTANIGFSIIVAQNVVLEEHTRIGHFNIIIVEENLVMRKGSIINNFNYIKVIKKLVLDVGAVIVKYNKIIRNNKLTQFGELYLGVNSIITVGHYLDLTDDIKIASNVVIGGIGSQFWTHGFDVKQNRVQGPITIGKECYIGSRSLINHGVDIASKTAIGMGTAVSKSIVKEGGFWVSQHLIRKCDVQDISKDLRYCCGQNNDKFFRLRKEETTEGDKIE